MSRFTLRRPSAGWLVAAIAVLAGGATTATATTMITGRTVKDGSLSGADLRDGSVGAVDLSKALQRQLASQGNSAEGAITLARTGARGADGAQGAQGEQGPAGAQGTAGEGGRYSAERWGVIGRNTIGSPVASYRVGPYARISGAMAAETPPPFGIGSLELHIDGTNGAQTTSEKIAFGNESDFAGLRVDDITSLGYWVFAGEDTLTGHGLPSIALEVDPNANGKTYASLMYMADSSTAPSQPASRAGNRWQRYDALAAGNKWFATADLATGTTLCESSSPCTWSELLGQLGPDAAVTYSVGVSKGRDTEFTGAVDGFEINGTTYDFEPDGAWKVAP